jgi:hypothetical protein
MESLSAAALVGVAYAFVGFREEKATDAGGGRGQMVERFVREMRDAALNEWSAAFVYHCGYWAHYDWRLGRSAWPLPAAGPSDLAEFAAEADAMRDEPQLGDVFVQYSAVRGEFVRAGIVLAATGTRQTYTVSERTIGKSYMDCEVIEANSTLTGRLDGPAVVRVRRPLSLARGDRFIRWTALAAAAAVREFTPVTLRVAA